TRRLHPPRKPRNAGAYGGTIKTRLFPSSGCRGPTSSCAWLGARHYLIEDIRANLGWIRVPFGLPVTVDLPIRTGETVLVSLAPLENRLVSRAEAAVWAIVRHRGDPTAGRCGVNDFAFVTERSQ